MKQENFIIQEMEVVYLPTKMQIDKEAILSSNEAYKLLKNLFNPNTISYQEECLVLYLNHASKLLGAQKLSKGGINSTVVDIRIILATALKSLSTGIILAHNHPSGKLVPSEADKRLTKQLNDACDLMDIKLIDHLIIGPKEGYYSFANEGLLF